MQGWRAYTFSRLTVSESERILPDMSNMSGKRTRVSAKERREDILAAAVTEFSMKGLHGASTVTIAERAGISQPNLFRLFPTKKALFIAALDRIYERVLRGAVSTAQTYPDDALKGMGRGYVTLLANRELMLLQLQGFAACDDPEIQAVMRQHNAQLFALIADMPGIDVEQARMFFAQGMLLTVAAAMNLFALADKEEWIGKFLGFIP